MHNDFRIVFGVVAPACKTHTHHLSRACGCVHSLQEHPVQRAFCRRKNCCVCAAVLLHMLSTASEPPHEPSNTLGLFEFDDVSQDYLLDVQPLSYQFNPFRNYSGMAKGFTCRCSTSQATVVHVRCTPRAISQWWCHCFVGMAPTTISSRK